jgi:hypothetical protein
MVVLSRELRARSGMRAILYRRIPEISLSLLDGDFRLGFRRQAATQNENLCLKRFRQGGSRHQEIGTLPNCEALAVSSERETAHGNPRRAS